MLKRLFVVLLIVFATVLVCSCKNEPAIPKDKENIAEVGVQASMEIITELNEKGSYPGVSVIEGENYSVAFKYADAVITESFASIDPSFGTHSVKINGEVFVSYEAYPSSYPCSVSINITFSFAGYNHSLECKVKYTGVSSYKASLFKFDGVEYDPESVS